MFDMSAMMGKIQEAQAKLKEAQESLRLSAGQQQKLNK